MGSFRSVQRKSCVPMAQFTTFTLQDFCELEDSTGEGDTFWEVSNYQI